MTLCVVTGVGPGVGSALVRSFCDAGYDVAMLARSEERLTQLSKDYPLAHKYTCDVGDASQLQQTAQAILAERGTPDVIIHNAIAGRMGSFLDVPSEEFERNFRVNTMGLIYLSKALLPSMLDRGKGMLMVTGSKYAYEASGSMVTFAVAKSSQRLFLESISAELASSDVKTCYAIVDGVVDSEQMRGYLPDKPDDFFLKAEAIAEICRAEVETPKHSELWISTSGVRRVS